MSLDRHQVLALAEEVLGRVGRARETIGFRSLGIDAATVCRPVDAQVALRCGPGRTLGGRLGVIEVLQALPLGEWVPVDSLTARENAILPAVPKWAVRRRNRQILRLADVPVEVDLVFVPGEDWEDALDRARRLGPAARRIAVCDAGPEDDLRARFEADYRGVGLAVFGGNGPRLLLPPPPRIPETAAALGWRLAEHVHLALRGRELNSATSTSPPSSRALRSV